MSDLFNNINESFYDVFRNFEFYLFFASVIGALFLLFIFGLIGISRSYITKNNKSFSRAIRFIKSVRGESDAIEKIDEYIQKNMSYLIVTEWDSYMHHKKGRPSDYLTLDKCISFPKANSTIIKSNVFIILIGVLVLWTAAYITHLFYVGEPEVYLTPLALAAAEPIYATTAGISIFIWVVLGILLLFLLNLILARRYGKLENNFITFLKHLNASVEGLVFKDAEDIKEEQRQEALALAKLRQEQGGQGGSSEQGGEQGENVGADLQAENFSADSFGQVPNLDGNLNSEFNAENFSESEPADYTQQSVPLTKAERKALKKQQKLEAIQNAERARENDKVHKRLVKEQQAAKAKAEKQALKDAQREAKLAKSNKGEEDSEQSPWFSDNAVSSGRENYESQSGQQNDYQSGQNGQNGQFGEQQNDYQNFGGQYGEAPDQNYYNYTEDYSTNQQTVGDHAQAVGEHQAVGEQYSASERQVSGEQYSASEAHSASGVMPQTAGEAQGASVGVQNDGHYDSDLCDCASCKPTSQHQGALQDLKNFAASQQLEHQHSQPFQPEQFQTQQFQQPPFDAQQFETQSFEPQHSQPQHAEQPQSFEAPHLQTHEAEQDFHTQYSEAESSYTQSDIKDEQLTDDVINRINKAAEKLDLNQFNDNNQTEFEAEHSDMSYGQSNDFGSFANENNYASGDYTGEFKGDFGGDYKGDFSGEFGDDYTDNFTANHNQSHNPNPTSETQPSGYKPPMPKQRERFIQSKADKIDIPFAVTNMQQEPPPPPINVPPLKPQLSNLQTAHRNDNLKVERPTLSGSMPLQPITNSAVANKSGNANSRAGVNVASNQGRIPLKFESADEIMASIKELSRQGGSMQKMQHYANRLHEERQKTENKTPDQQRRLNEALGELVKAMTRYQSSN